MGTPRVHAIRRRGPNAMVRAQSSRLIALYQVRLMFLPQGRGTIRAELRTGCQEGEGRRWALAAKIVADDDFLGFMQNNHRKGVDAA